MNDLGKDFQRGSEVSA